MAYPLAPNAATPVFGSLYLGRLFGIQIRVSWLFLPLLALLLMAAAQGGLASIFLLVSVLGCVLLHELGHALVAQRYGLVVQEIKFWLLGGVAQMSAIPEHPRVEGMIALAGPAVNLALAVATLPLFWLGANGWLSPGAAHLVDLFLVVNLALGLFNLLPAFPMDGGRLLRAALATRLSWLSATEIAVRTGRWVALTVALFGVLVWHGGMFLLPIIAVYVWWQGSLELHAVRLRHGVHPLASLFGRGFAGGFPDPAGNPFGGGPRETTQPDFDVSPRPGPSAPAPESGPRGARRPQVMDPGQLPRGGLSEAEIEALERFPGRLRRGGDSEIGRS